jgi:SPP1 family predicted phage head-tail adaptor
MRAGKLSRRVTYQVETKTRDGLGDESLAWSDVGTYWAEVRSPTGTEALNASQIKAVATHVIVHRYPGFVPSPNARYLYGTRVFNIRWASDVEERRRRVTAFCEEQVSPVPQGT